MVKISCRMTMSKVERINNGIKRQKLRRNKRSWRKNIDVEDVISGLERKRDKEILFGESDKERSETLRDYEVDENREKTVLNKKKADSTARRILNNQSKIRAIEHHRWKDRKNNGSKCVLKKQKKLEKKTAPQKEVLLDLWGQDTDILRPDNADSTEKTGLRFSSNNLKKKEVIDPGLSYNPNVESWNKLITKEYEIELKKEKERNACKEHFEKFKQVIDEEESYFGSFCMSENDENSNIEDNGDFKLSCNPAVKVNYKKNNKKFKKRRIKVDTSKKKDPTLKEIDEIVSSCKNINNERTIKEKKKKKIFKYDPIEKPLTLKLLGDLIGSLRMLKQEGNHFYDQMHKLQLDAKIEPRLLLRKRRKYPKKIREKRAFKI